MIAENVAYVANAFNQDGEYCKRRFFVSRWAANNWCRCQLRPGSKVSEIHIRDMRTLRLIEKKYKENQNWGGE